MTQGHIISAPLENGHADDLRTTALAMDIVRGLHGVAGIPSHAVSGGDALVTPRMRHGEIHDYVPAMPCHLVGTSYTTIRDAFWRTEGKRIGGSARPGNISVIPSGHDGTWDVPIAGEISHVYLADARLQSCAEQLAGGRRVELIGRVAFEDASSSLILELLGRQAAAREPSSSLFIDQAIDFLCLQLVRGHSSFGALAAPAPRRGLADWQVKRVTAYMRERLDEEIALDDLAAIVTLSRFHFCTAFRMATGHTPHEWLVMQRIERARQLLGDPSLRITDIALAVGYGTPSAFAASFRKLTGLTPTAFRRDL